MNWYKLAQITDFPTYLTQQIAQLSNNYNKEIPYRIKEMLKYIPFMEEYTTKYNIPYQQMTLEELFRTCTYILNLEKNPKNISHLPKDVQNNPTIQKFIQNNPTIK